MKLKIAFAIILNIIFQNNYMQINNVYLFSKSEKKILILEDFHSMSSSIEYPLGLSELQFYTIDNWLSHLSEKTNFLFEVGQSALKLKFENIQKCPSLINKILYKAINSKDSKIKFCPADIRDYQKECSYKSFFNSISTTNLIQRILDLSIYRNVFEKDQIVTYSKILNCNIQDFNSIELIQLKLYKYSIDQTKEIIQAKETQSVLKNLQDRIERITNSQQRKIMLEKLKEFNEKIIRWQEQSIKITAMLSNMNSENFGKNCLFFQTFTEEGKDLMLINFADLGFIVSILEELQNYNQIILLAGSRHIENINEFLQNHLGYDRTDFEYQRLDESLLSKTAQNLDDILKNIFINQSIESSDNFTYTLSDEYKEIIDTTLGS